MNSEVTKNYCLYDTVEIRVTRPSFYPPDYQDPAHQQGYYFRGRADPVTGESDVEVALRKARETFPHERLTSKVWKVFREGVWQPVY